MHQTSLLPSGCAGAGREKGASGSTGLQWEGLRGPKVKEAPVQLGLGWQTNGRTGRRVAKPRTISAVNQGVASLLGLFLWVSELGWCLR